MSSQPAIGGVDLGDLRRTRPIDPYFGYGRGTPVDRYYIETFLAAHAADIRGHVLEVKDSRYTRRFGGEGVARSSVLDVTSANRSATLLADLSRPDSLPASAYDCFICTQTLQFVYDSAAAISGIERMLRPGGMALITVPGITQRDESQRETSGEYWRFTADSLRRLLEPHFTPGTLEVRTYGNVLSAVALLLGLAAEDLAPEELAPVDPTYEVVVAARCRKRGS